MEKYIRELDNKLFWYDFYINNYCKLQNLRKIKNNNNKFLSRLFNSKDSNHVYLIDYDILDKKSNIISYIVLNILSNNFNDSFDEDFDIIDMIKYEKELIDNCDYFERTLMCVYADETESKHLNVKIGSKILLIKTKYIVNNKVIIYKEEYTNLFTFKFKDEYNERISV